MLVEKAEFGRMSKSIQKVAERLAAKDVEKIRSKNSQIRARKDFLEKQSKWNPQ